MLALFLSMALASPPDIDVDIDIDIDAAVAEALAFRLVTQEGVHDGEQRPREISPGSSDHESPRKKTDAALDAPLPAAGSSSTPQGRTFGIGLQLGYPTSVTAKYMLQSDQGLVFGIGGFSSFAYDAAAVSIHVDYLYHPSMLTSADAFVVTWYVGGGGNVIINSNPTQRTTLRDLRYFRAPTQAWLGARVPVGVALAMTQQPFEIHLEAIPSVLLFPGVGFGIGAAIGARFYL